MTSGKGVSVGVAVASTSVVHTSPAFRATGAVLPTQQCPLTCMSSGAADARDVGERSWL